jgi:hypothetical protein
MRLFFCENPIRMESMNHTDGMNNFQADTVTVTADDVTSPFVAVTSVVPAATPVTFPVLATVALDTAFDAHCDDAVTSIVEASANVATAFS